MNSFSRRSLLKGVLGTAGLAAGSRLAPFGAGSFVREARAAGNPAGRSAVVVVWMPGGYSSIFGSPDALVGRPWPALKASDIVDIGSGASAFSVHKLIADLPFAKTNMASVGVGRIPADHGAASTYMWANGNANYALRLAAEMGGDASIKAAAMGNYIPGESSRAPQGGVSLEIVKDMNETLKALGASGGAVNTKAPARDVSAKLLERSRLMSGRDITMNPASLAAYDGAYKTMSETFVKPTPKLPSFAEIAAPYEALFKKGGKIGAKVEHLYSKFVGAELMLRSGTNFVLISDGEDEKNFRYDLHEQDGTRDIDWIVGNDYQSTYRDSQMIKALGVFLDRVFTAPGLSDMNVTVAFMGEFSRTVPDSGHNSNVTATVFGSRVKPGTTGRCNAQNDLPASTPSADAFWGYLADLSGVTSKPFGATKDFHRALIA